MVTYLLLFCLCGTGRAGVAIKFCVCTVEVPAANFDLDSGYSEFFHGFTQSLQVYAVMVPPLVYERFNITFSSFIIYAVVRDPDNFVSCSTQLPYYTCSI
jgi:hypothetical protein